MCESPTPIAAPFWVYIRSWRPIYRPYRGFCWMRKVFGIGGFRSFVRGLGGLAVWRFGGWGFGILEFSGLEGGPATLAGDSPREAQEGTKGQL